MIEFYKLKVEGVGEDDGMERGNGKSGGEEGGWWLWIGRKWGIMKWCGYLERIGGGWWNGGKNKAMACKNEMEMEMICSLCMYTLHNPRQ